MRIIIFSDSLGRPRPDIDPSERTEYEETYPYLLKQQHKNEELDIIYIESLDSEDGLFWNERMVSFRKPDIVIYHFGINDCAPRIFSKNTKSILFRPWFRKATRDIFVRAIHSCRRHLIRTLFRNKVYISVNAFERNIQKMIDDVKKYSPQCRFYALSISSKPDWFEYRSPGINRNIQRYNESLKRIFDARFIDIDKMVGLKAENYLISDGIHFKKETHRRVAESLQRSLQMDKAEEQEVT